jgi:ribosomal-protein-alanine N-acetyltransferase
VGQVHLSSLVRGAFQSCNLGYALDAGCQGRGLMHEALQAIVDEAFSPRLNLHRIQAGVRPENHRSLAVLARLGFAEIGLARAYLFIDGAWRDHRLFDLTNPSFVQQADW